MKSEMPLTIHKVYCRNGEDRNSKAHILRRIFNRIKVVPKTGCWEWQGCRNGHGYGCMTINGRTYAVSKVLYELTVGMIPRGKFLCHHCDNPPCINPAHMFVGTQSDNMKDCFDKGRIKPPICPRPGESNGQAKLSWSQVNQIRKLASEGLSCPEIAKVFLVCKGQIWNIVTKRCWQ